MADDLTPMMLITDVIFVNVEYLVSSVNYIHMPGFKFTFNSKIVRSF